VTPALDRNEAVRAAADEALARAVRRILGKAPTWLVITTKVEFMADVMDRHGMRELPK
jgi:hypothetical protein